MIEVVVARNDCGVEAREVAKNRFPARRRME